MAPEIVKGNYYNQKVDIWSIGVICYMLLSGRSPFPGQTPDDIKHMIVHMNINLESKRYFDDISDEAKDFVMQCLERNIHLRYSAQELLDHKWLK
jgi:serine/threonine protein kinase